MASRWEVLRALGGVVLAVGLGACAPGYMKASDLERNEQGPSACRARCEELGMRMAALVLVGDTLPGCVCQPLIKQGEQGAPPSMSAPPGMAPQPSAPAPAPAPAPESGADMSNEGASAATTGFVVIAAAAAAQRAQQQRQQQQQQQQKN